MSRNLTRETKNLTLLVHNPYETFAHLAPRLLDLSLRRQEIRQIGGVGEETEDAGAGEFRIELGGGKQVVEVDRLRIVQLFDNYLGVLIGRK